MEALAAVSTDSPTLPFTLDDTIEPVTWRRPRPGLFEAAGATHPGKVRATNEDAHGVYPEFGLCAVADGLGGRSAGDVASAMGVFHAREVVSRSAPCTAAEAELVMRGAIEQANAAVRHAGESDPRWKGMGSTFVGLLFCGGHVVIGHAGDSRAYRVRGGIARRLTADHSMRELYLQVYGDRADPAVAERNASIVTRALGAKATIQPDVRVETVEPGDVFLLCTDGLWGLVDDEEIAFAFAGASSLEGAIARLVATAYNRGGPDNITAVAVRPFAESSRRSWLAG